MSGNVGQILTVIAAIALIGGVSFAFYSSSGLTGDVRADRHGSNESDRDSLNTTITSIEARLDALEARFGSGRTDEVVPGSGSNVARGSDLDNRLQELERAIAELGRSSTVGGAVSDGQRELIESLVEESLSTRANQEQLEENRQAAERRKAEAAEYVQGEMEELTALRDELGLSDAQLVELEEMMTSLAIEWSEADEAGDREERAAVERKWARETQRIMGSEAYREMNLLEMNSETRRGLRWLGFVGADETQRADIERQLVASNDRLVDQQIRLDTEEMPQAAREQLQREIEAAQTSAWDDAASNSLTAEQLQQIEQWRNARR